jgi:hypothetical protein
MVQPIRPHDPRLRHGDMQEPPVQNVRHGPRHPLERGGPRVGRLLPGARGEGDAGAVIGYQPRVLERAAPQGPCEICDDPGPVAIALHDPHMPLRLRRVTQAVQEVDHLLRPHRLRQGEHPTGTGLPDRVHQLPPTDGHHHPRR